MNIEQLIEQKYAVQMGLRIAEAEKRAATAEAMNEYYRQTIMERDEADRLRDAEPATPEVPDEPKADHA